MADEATKARDGIDYKVDAPPAPQAAEAAKVDDKAKPAEDEASDSIFSEFFLFLKEEKKWWLAPLITVLLLLSAVILFAEGSAIAPFIYTIF